jgi:hypothetical protein
MADHAKFTAEISKGINIKESNVEVKLLIPLKTAQQHLIFLSSNQGEKVNVFLGDPQVSMNFSDEEEDAMYQKFTGRYVTTDASGVVTKVEEKEEDENQVELFDENGEPVIASEGQEDVEGGNTDETDQQDDEGTAEGATEGDGDGLGDDLPDWMKDGNGPEMNFDKDGQGSPTPEEHDEHEQPAGETEPGQPEGEEQQEATGEITKEQLEEYILNLKPSFPDIDLDFPNLVEKRRNGETWLGLSQQLGIPSSQLSSKYRKYKDKVKDLMQGAGVA